MLILHIYKRKGTDDDPFLFLIDENYVRSGALVLKEIPSCADGFKVIDSSGNELVEVTSDNLSFNEYRVDYSVGIVYFHEGRNGEKVICEYYGTGYVSISASRIWMISDSDNPLKSLEEAMDNVEEGIRTLEQVGNLDFKGEYSDAHQYKKWNFVIFNNKTYVATKDVVGIEPTNTSHWRLVSSGVGFEGVYDSSRVYSIGDIVVDESRKNMYVSKIDNNNESLSNTEAWDKLLTLDDSVQHLYDEIDNQIQLLNNLKDQLEDAERMRVENEEERDGKVLDGLAQLNLAKQQFEQSEIERQNAESDRNTQEAIRNQNEIARQNQEQIRENNEVFRQEQEEIRNQIVDASLSRIDDSLNDVNESINMINSVKNELENLTERTNQIIDDAQDAISNTIGWIHKEEYDPLVHYEKNNIISYKGSTYQAIQDVVGIAPDTFIAPDEDEDSESEVIDGKEYWRLIAGKGEDGRNITVEGIEPDEDGNISLQDLDIVRVSDFESKNNEINQKIGNMQTLRTIHKDSIVGAINELKQRTDELIDIVSQLGGV